MNLYFIPFLFLIIMHSNLYINYYLMYSIFSLHYLLYTTLNFWQFGNWIYAFPFSSLCSLLNLLSCTRHSLFIVKCPFVLGLLMMLITIGGNSPYVFRHSSIAPFFFDVKKYMNYTHKPKNTILLFFQCIWPSYTALLNIQGFIPYMK